MKKRLLLSLALLATTNFTFAQFTPDNLVVVKSTALPSNSAGAVNLVELTTTTPSVLSTDVPIGNNNFYVGHAASTVNNGYLNLSTDKKYLTIYGYSALPSSGTVQSLVGPRALGIIDENKNINLVSIPFHNSTQARSALAYPIPNEIGFYGVYLGGGGTGGIGGTAINPSPEGLNYVKLKTNDFSITDTSHIANFNTASLGIFNNILYAGTGLTSNPTTNKVAIIDNDNNNNLPHLKTTITDLTVSPFNIVKIPGNIVSFGNKSLYIADETAGIYKFYLNETASPAIWENKGLITPPNTLTDQVGFRGMVGRLESGKVTLYAVTNSSTKNSIVKIIDASSSATAILSNADENLTINVLSTITTNNSGYRGISFTPNSTITLPVSLNSFTAKTINGNIAINWSTASEQNNKYFEILRSIDGVSFTKIGEMAGKNNSNSLNKYSFTDYTPISGTNYYQLKQVDINGESEIFGPVSAKVGFESKNNIDVINNEGTIKFVITTDKNINSRLKIIDISGKTHFAKQVQLNSGVNMVILEKNLADGIYIVKIDANDLSIAQKFKK